MEQSRRTELIKFGIRVVQTRAMYGNYQRLFYNAESGEFIKRTAGSYLSVDELENACEQLAKGAEETNAYFRS